MPATSIRDLVIKDDDIVVGTHGRSFWILDDVTPLRQLTPAVAQRSVVLFAPQMATRFRWNKNSDTPLPPDEPAGENPPDGAVIDYWLGAPARSAVTLEIVDPAGRVARRYTSTDTAMAPTDIGNTPRYWIRPTRVLPATPGMHRFVWDLHYETPPGLEQGYPISATPFNTPREPGGPWAVPGRYAARLTVDGAATTRSFVLRMDPRVKTPTSVVAEQFASAMRLAALLRQGAATLDSVRAARKGLASARERAGQGTQADSLATYDEKLGAIEGANGGGRGGAAGARGVQPSLASVTAEIGQLYQAVEQADAAPTIALAAAIRDVERKHRDVMSRWNALHSQRNR
jgi:hypothetical protein